MKRFILTTLSLALIAGPAFAQTSKDDVVDFGEPVPLTVISEGGSHTFSIERAVSLDQQARGMMFRETMEADSGMLFECFGNRGSQVRILPPRPLAFKNPNIIILSLGKALITLIL